MTKPPPVLISLTCVAVAALSLLGARYPRPERDVLVSEFSDEFGVAQVQQRLAPALKRFPHDSVVGLLTNADDTDVMVYRWILKPRQVALVKQGSRPPLAIALVPMGVDEAAFAAKEGYEPAERLEHGLMVYRTVQ